MAGLTFTLLFCLCSLYDMYIDYRFINNVATLFNFVVLHRTCHYECVTLHLQVGHIIYQYCITLSCAIGN